MECCQPLEHSGEKQRSEEAANLYSVGWRQRGFRRDVKGKEGTGLWISQSRGLPLAAVAENLE